MKTKTRYENDFTQLYSWRLSGQSRGTSELLEPKMKRVKMTVKETSLKGKDFNRNNEEKRYKKFKKVMDAFNCCGDIKQTAERLKMLVKTVQDIVEPGERWTVERKRYMEEV